jgi:hypothetical protein
MKKAPTIAGAFKPKPEKQFRELSGRLYDSIFILICQDLF